MSCEWARRAMEQQFAGELPAQEAARLDGHLAGCAPCREAYQRLARVDAALERGGLSEPRLDALQARILARVGAAAPSEAEPALPPSRRLLGALFAAAAVLVVAVPAWRAGRDDGWAPRGQPGATWGVRAFCVVPGAGVTAEARPDGVLRCAPGATVQFTYTAPRPAQLAVFLEGTDQRFYPTQGERTAVQAGTDVALPLSTPVGAWLTAPRRVTARFTDDSGTTLAETSLTLTPR